MKELACCPEWTTVNWQRTANWGWQWLHLLECQHQKGPSKGQCRLCCQLSPTETNFPDNLSDRLEILQLPMGSQRLVPWVNAYAQTMTNSDHTKDKFYKEGDTIIADVLTSEKFFIPGDFSARVAAPHASLRFPLVENVMAMYHWVRYLTDPLYKMNNLDTSNTMQVAVCKFGESRTLRMMLISMSGKPRRLFIERRMLDEHQSRHVYTRAFAKTKRQTTEDRESTREICFLVFKKYNPFHFVLRWLRSSS